MRHYQLIILQALIFLATSTLHAQTVDRIQRDYPNAPVIRLLSDVGVFQTPNGGESRRTVSIGDSLILFREHLMRYAVASFSEGFIGFIDKKNVVYTGFNISGGVFEVAEAPVAVVTEDDSIISSDTLITAGIPENSVIELSVEYYELLKSKHPSALTESEILYMQWVEDTKQTKAQETISKVMVISMVIAGVSLLISLFALSSM